MLGLKIAATGAFVLLASGICIAHVGRWPGAWKGATLLIAWYGGTAAVLIGLLMALWA